MAERDPARLTRSDNREFAFVVAGAFFALAGLGWWQDHTWLLYGGLAAGGLLGASGALIPGRLGPLHRAWMTMAEGISKITTPLVMAVIYLTVLTPAGLLRRLFGGNPVQRQPNDGSYWVERDSPNSDLHRQF